ncbi:MAG: hypothetical protein J3R72DRAFT_220828 [Linnemannia gamsii]|nr:MAG: hypothetical protein J3R72DRAFT_220828 [Linnemannia gamsii]
MNELLFVGACTPSLFLFPFESNTPLCFLLSSGLLPLASPAKQLAVLLYSLILTLTLSLSLSPSFLYAPLFSSHPLSSQLFSLLPPHLFFFFLHLLLLCTFVSYLIQ